MRKAMPAANRRDERDIAVLSAASPHATAWPGCDVCYAFDAGRNTHCLLEVDNSGADAQRSCENTVIRKLKSGAYRLYSRKPDPKTGKRRNLGTFKTRSAAEQHERAVQYFKRRG
jgi:hypothetical protein